MLLVLSPAKSLDFDTPVATRTNTQPELLDESAKLISALRRMSPENLSELMHISGALGELNFRRNLGWQTPFDRSNARQAIFAFTGDVYMGLDARSLSKRDLDFAQVHLRILSGLYGVLRPLDLMQAYRLEMGTALKHGQHNNLYEFWGDRITRQLNETLSAIKKPFLLNLASVEYFRAVNTKILQAPVISPVFRDYKNGQYKIISFFAKKARGTMASYVVRNRIRKIDDVLRFDLDGYRYSPGDSTAHSPVFLRKQL